ncbi:MAG: hypothetical protein O3A46_10970, partial [Candidatus Poribacteria bacterium]|nr:hypothetical protein [Candidatus Poribacteria bacterium]
TPTLSLVDWECMGKSPAALDVAKHVYHTWGASGASWIDALGALYFEQYMKCGGTGYTAESWDRAYRLGIAAHALMWFPTHGGANVRKADEGALVDWVDNAIAYVTPTIRELAAS